MSDGNADWNSEFAFKVDNGELDGVSLVESFTIGFELGQLYEAAQSHCGINKPVSARNQDRIRALMEKFSRSYSLVHMPNDASESWMHLIVQPEPSFD